MAAKKKGSGETAAKAPAAPALSKFQSFTMERLHRSQLVTAKYNPRVISDEAKARLQRNLKKVGLLEPLILNRTTGTLLGGHQRLACLDALEGSPDYLLDVSVVELSAKEEVEQNIALNNGNLQGEYDMDLLAELLKTPDLELDATGFDLAEIQVTFDDPELATLFATNETTKKVVSELEKQHTAAKTKERIQKERERDGERYVATDDTEVYAVVLFKTRLECDAFLGAMGAGDSRYVDGARVLEKLEALIPEQAKSGARRPGTAETAAPAPSPKPSADTTKAKRPARGASRKTEGAGPSEA